MTAHARTTIPPNAFKAGLRARHPQVGLWSSLCDNVVAEVLGHAGYDWIVIDTDHAPGEPLDLVSRLQALATGTAEPVVRVAWNDAVLIRRLLDVGVRCLLVPSVRSAEQARSAVAATRYPPHGVRGVSPAHRADGFGRVTGHIQNGHQEICVLVQLETPAALDHLEEIAGMEGVNGLFLGAADLAAAMGHLGDQMHSAVQAALADACARILAAGKPAGIFAASDAEASGYFAMGFTFVAIGSDIDLLAAGSSALAARVHEALAKPAIPMEL